MSGKCLQLHPVQMDEPLMKGLEKRGLIILLGPGRHEVEDLEPETGKDIKLYISNPEHGPHQLLAVTKNQSRFLHFGSHRDNEEFLLIGDPDTKPLYLLVALMKHEELDRKAASEGLTAEDFLLIRCAFNDPRCSFFTMLRDIPHCECTSAGDRRSPSFYVTEPAAMPSRVSALNGFDFEVVDP